MSGGCPELSVIVISYNMGRELLRTLYSLSPQYQQGIDASDYEIIVIDNGSHSPPTLEEFADLGINLRVISFPNPTQSPVRAINHGLTLARAPLIGSASMARAWQAPVCWMRVGARPASMTMPS